MPSCFPRSKQHILLPSPFRVIPPPIDPEPEAGFPKMVPLFQGRRRARENVLPSRLVNPPPLDSRKEFNFSCWFARNLEQNYFTCLSYFHFLKQGELYRSIRRMDDEVIFAVTMDQRFFVVTLQPESTLAVRTCAGEVEVRFAARCVFPSG